MHRVHGSPCRVWSVKITKINTCAHAGKCRLHCNCIGVLALGRCMGHLAHPGVVLLIQWLQTDLGHLFQLFTLSSSPHLLRFDLLSLLWQPISSSLALVIIVPQCSAGKFHPMTTKKPISMHPIVLKPWYARQMFLLTPQNGGHSQASSARGMQGYQ